MNILKNYQLGVFHLLILSFAIEIPLFSAAAIYAQTTKSTKAEFTKVVVENTSKPVGISPVASFVNDKTLFVAKINLKNVDIDLLGSTVEDLFSQVINQLGFTPSSTDNCAKEFHKTVDGFKTEKGVILKDSLNSLGFTEIYYIVQSSKNEGACFIIPAQSMTAEQIDSVKNKFESNQLNCALYQKSFIIASSISLKEVGSYYKTFKPTPNKKLEAFFHNNSDKFLTFYTGRFKIRTPLANTLNLIPHSDVTMIKESEREDVSSTQTAGDESARRSIVSSKNFGRKKLAEIEKQQSFLQGESFGQSEAKKKVEDPFEKYPRCVKDLIETFDSSFTEGYGYIDISTLSSSISLKFSSAVNAGKFKQDLSKTLDVLISSIFEFLQTMVDVAQTNTPSIAGIDLNTDIIKEYRLIPLIKEIMLGELRPRLPHQNGPVLTFESDVKNEFAKIGPNTMALLGETILTFQMNRTSTPTNNKSFDETEEDLSSVFKEETQNESSDATQSAVTP